MLFFCQEKETSVLSLGVCVSVTEIYVFCPSEVNVRSHVCVVLSWEVNARSHVCVVLSCGVNVRSYVFVFVFLSFLLLSLSMVILTVIFVEVFFCLEIWKVKEEIIHLRLVIIMLYKN